MNTDKSFKAKRMVIIGGIVFVLLVIAATLVMRPYFIELSEPETQEQFREWVTSLGFTGYLIMLGIQIIQILIAIIPGEPVEVLAGVIYGTWGGLLICLIGCVIATYIVFYLSRVLGIRLIKRIFGVEKVEGWSFLRNTKRLEILTFVLFLIPGVPKDTLTYVAGLCEVNPVRFVLISTFARIPSIISSTMIGSSARNGSWGIFILVFVLTALICLVAIIYKDSIINHFRSHSPDIENKNQDSLKQ